MSTRRMKPSRAVLRTMAVATFALLWCGTASAGGTVPELDPGSAAGGIALVSIAAILLFERYKSR